MTTQTANIVAAIAARLTGAGLSVRMSTVQPYSFEDFPVIVVDVGGEHPSPVLGGTGGLIYWDLDVSFYIAAVGATPKIAPEATRQAAHVALYSDRTFGGLAVDIVAGVVNRRIDNDNPGLGIAQCTYTVKYRIGESTL
jgi:hypothetical protein